MDINSLLSPQDSPAPEAELRSPSKKMSSNSPPTSAPVSRSGKYNVSHAGTAPSPPMPSPPPGDFPHRLHRQTTTSGMDTLADLASMQHHQQLARANAGGLKNTESYEAQLSSVNIRPSLQAMTRTHSGSRSSLDIRMADAPAQTPPATVFTAPSLSEAELHRASELMEYLTENAHAYDSHVQLIKLLYHGLISHVYPTTAGVQENDPNGYTLLGDLKQAIETMSTRFSLGEELCEIKLHVSQLTAVNLEDCMAIMEAFEKAVVEEPTSSRLWPSYGEWILVLYSGLASAATSAPEVSRQSQILAKLSDEDKLVAREVFTRDQMMQVWSRGTEDTRHRIDESHIVWNKYLDLRVRSLEPAATSEEIAEVMSLFKQRLGEPHSNWEDTFQRFSTFISTYDNANYEEIMVDVNRHSAKAKNIYSEREIYEIKIRQAVSSSDSAAEWATYAEYLEWELSRNRKKNFFHFDLVNALYLRILLRFPSVVDAWEDYLTFLADEGARGIKTASQLSILGRACDHCPWSGTLWSQYILAAELENLPFADIEQIKHKATSTGLLDIGGIDEVLQIHSAWCGCLKRKAFQHNSTDDELDVAEVGIRSAMEDVETLGKTKYGAKYKGDPQYRLERIYIKFLTQSHNYQGARDTWKDLIQRHGGSYEFWLRYYSWEMLVWAGVLASERQSVSHEAPSEATIVLRQAVQRPRLDWPEKIIETYLSHCEDHENVAELQTAMLLCRRATKQVQERRQREGVEAADSARQQQEALEDVGVSQRSKRKRETGDEEDIRGKKLRPEDVVAPKAPQEDAPSAQTRDRENATVIVKNLPSDVTEKRIRHFFSDCGKISGIHLLPNEQSATATLEFETKEDALTAQTKDQKVYEDNIIEVQIGTGTTLYVTNFPPTSDEAHIKDLFDKYGTIIDVRFPSLKYDTHRRFCYLQFQTAEQAHAATQLDGTEVGDGLKLLVKISDPARKKARQGPMHEEREIYVANVDWKANEKTIEDIFSKYGKVESVRIPRKVGGQSKGFAFVVFSNKDEATSALALDKTEFMSRALNVEISTPNPSKRQATTVLRRQTPTDDDKQERSSSDRGSSAKTIREEIASRTVVLLNIPDTVNDARIKDLMQHYGELVKVTLRPDHQGAIVEYKDVNAAGKAALGIEGREIGPGRRLRVGTFEELKHEKAEIRDSTLQPAPKKSGEASKATATSMQPSMSIRRPVQRAGRRGGLGFRSSNLARGGDSAQADNTTAINGHGKRSDGVPSEAKGSKSNADFKAMLAQ